MTFINYEISHCAVCSASRYFDSSTNILSSTLKGPQPVSRPRMIKQVSRPHKIIDGVVYVL
jgi:hypothetical protein